MYSDKSAQDYKATHLFYIQLLPDIAVKSSCNNRKVAWLREAVVNDH